MERKNVNVMVWLFEKIAKKEKKGRKEGKLSE